MVQHVYAVAGAKGGVGKTTTSINLGTALVDLGWSVAVVETDLAMANLLDFLDVDVDAGTDPTLHDVLGEGTPIEEAMYGAPGGLDVLPSGVDLEGFAAADLRRLGDVVADLRSTYDVILLDAGAGLSRETLYPPAIADSTILVSSPRVASVRDTEKTKALTERVGGDVEGVVFVESGTGTAPPVERIADFLGVDLLGHVPEDEAVPVSQDAGRPVVAHAADSPAASAYRSIAADLETALLDDGPVAAAGATDPGDVIEEAVRSSVEADGGSAAAIEGAGPEGTADDESPEDSPEETTLAEASDAADLLDGGPRLDAERSVDDLWETADDGAETGPDAVIDRAFEDARAVADSPSGERHRMPEPPSASDPIGSADAQGTDSPPDDGDDVSGEQVTDGGPEVGSSRGSANHADGDDSRDGSITGRLRGLLGAALSLGE